MARRTKQLVAYASELFIQGSSGMLHPDVHVPGIYDIHAASMDAVRGLTKAELLLVVEELCAKRHLFEPSTCTARTDEPIEFDVMIRELVANVIACELEAHGELSLENLQRWLRFEENPRLQAAHA